MPIQKTAWLVPLCELMSQEAVVMTYWSPTSDLLITEGSLPTYVF